MYTGFEEERKKIFSGMSENQKRAFYKLQDSKRLLDARAYVLKRVDFYKSCLAAEEWIYMCVLTPNFGKMLNKKFYKFAREKIKARKKLAGLPTECMYVYDSGYNCRLLSITFEKDERLNLYEKTGYFAHTFLL